MTEHEITLDLDYPLPEDPGRLIVTCSCGEILWIEPVPVEWVKVSLAVAEHLRPQAEMMMKELLKMISVRDILKVIRKKLLYPGAPGDDSEDDKQHRASEGNLEDLPGERVRQQYHQLADASDGEAAQDYQQQVPVCSAGCHPRRLMPAGTPGSALRAYVWSHRQVILGQVNLR